MTKSDLAVTKEEFRQNAAISALQAVVEAKYGIIGELDTDLAAKMAIRLADSLTKKYYEKEDGSVG